MTTKQEIVSELGEQALLLPVQVNAGLLANEQVKYYLTLLQAARLRADRPTAPAPNLRAEREASGVEDPSLDEVPARSRSTGDGLYDIDRAAELHRAIVDGVSAMIRPLETDDPDGLAADLRSRLAQVVARVSSFDGQVSAEQLDVLTSVRGGEGDSLHRLVLDLHRALNRLQQRLAQEEIDGASAYGLEDGDRPLVGAFMRGVNATAALKFDHPGLGTTATRSGLRLVIQNDIGQTDAHVLVVHVEGMQVTLTHSDVHPRRIRFFQQLFQGFPVHWTATSPRQAGGLARGRTFHICTGRYVAGSSQDLERYLEFLGSRLVFLIDWNRARHSLEHFVRRRDAIDLLREAADENLGHRAYLELGGERLISAVVQQSAPIPVRFGERLDDIMGHDELIAFLRYALRSAAEGLLNGRSDRLIRDELRAELANHFLSAEAALLQIAGDHAELIAELATSAWGALMERAAGGPRDRARALTNRAKAWEQRADSLVAKARADSGRSPASAFCASLLISSDDAVGALEEVAFLLGLLPPVERPDELLQPLQTLAAVVVESAHEYVKAVESARFVGRSGARDDVEDCLAAVDRLTMLEHNADEAERIVTSMLFDECIDFRVHEVVSRIAASLEKASDSLSRSGLALRDHVLAQMVAS